MSTTAISLVITPLVFFAFCFALSCASNVIPRLSNWLELEDCKIANAVRFLSDLPLDILKFFVWLVIITVLLLVAFSCFICDTARNRISPPAKLTNNA